MKRREFLKVAAGLAAVPVIGAVGHGAVNAAPAVFGLDFAALRDGTVVRKAWFDGEKMNFQRVAREQLYSVGAAQ